MVRNISLCRRKIFEPFAVERVLSHRPFRRNAQPHQFARVPVNIQFSALRPSEPLDLRNFLRRQTAEAHRSVDRTFGEFPIAGEDGYRQFLRISAKALFPLEHGVEASGVLSLLPDWEARARRRALAADLQSMGEHPPGQDTQGDPWRGSFLLGVLYTLEGSRLGAGVMHRQVEGKGYPTAYLRHGEGQRLWPTFCARLSATPAESVDLTELVGGAQHAFAAFERAAMESRNRETDLES